MSAEPATASFRAIGTTVVVAVTDPAALEDARAITEAYVDELDLAASRFRDDSELSRANAAAGRPTHVSALLVDLVEVALRAAESTDGLVDPSLGAAMRIIGYDRDFAELAAPRDHPAGADRPVRLTARIRQVPGWQAVRLDRDRRTLTVPAGVELDLGATAKARVADLAAHAVADATGGGALVSLGGDLAVAGEVPPGGFVVRVADRHDAGPDEPGVTIALSSGGLATSGTAARRWEHAGRTMHHLVDPATGLPAETCWRTVTVAASSCLEANTATTASIIMGWRAEQWLGVRGLPARLVAGDGHAVAVAGWPADALLATADAAAAETTREPAWA